MGNSLLLWGERGLMFALFKDLSDNKNKLIKFLNKVDFGVSLNLKASNINEISIIIEPDFGNKGFGHPDVVIIIEQSNEKRVFILEAKRTPYEKSSVNPGKRGTKGFNSTINGQLELNYCLTLALLNYRNNNRYYLEDPDWLLRTEYNKERKGVKRVIKNINVIDNFIPPLVCKKLTHYFHIIITTDNINPLSKINSNLPALYNKEGYNIWKDQKKQFGWINYKNINSIVGDDMSLYNETFKLNRRNMKTETSNTKISKKRAVFLVYIPNLYKNNVFHCSLVNDTCKLRYYSTKEGCIICYHESYSAIEGKIKEIKQVTHIKKDDVKYWSEQIKIYENELVN